MNNASNVVSYALAALAGVFFVTGLALLTDEGSAMNHGPSTKNSIDA